MSRNLTAGALAVLLASPFAVSFFAPELLIGEMTDVYSVMMDVYATCGLNFMEGSIAGCSVIMALGVLSNIGFYSSQIKSAKVIKEAEAEVELKSR